MFKIVISNGSWIVTLISIKKEIGFEKINSLFSPFIFYKHLTFDIDEISSLNPTTIFHSVFSIVVVSNFIIKFDDNSNILGSYSTDRLIPEAYL